jgi:hypothetical protein
VSSVDFDAAKLRRDAEVAGEAFGFEDAQPDAGHDAASRLILLCSAGAVGALVVAAMFLA